jgi:hypothetical protein
VSLLRCLPKVPSLSRCSFVESTLADSWTHPQIPYMSVGTKYLVFVCPLSCRTNLNITSTPPQHRHSNQHTTLRSSSTYVILHSPACHFLRTLFWHTCRGSTGRASGSPASAKFTLAPAVLHRRSLRKALSSQLRSMNLCCSAPMHHMTIHTHTQTHTHVYTHTHICIYTHTHTHIQTHTDTRTQAHKHTSASAHKHTSTQAFKHKRTHRGVQFLPGRQSVCRGRCVPGLGWDDRDERDERDGRRGPEQRWFFILSNHF